MTTLLKKYKEQANKLLNTGAASNECVGVDVKKTIVRITTVPISLEKLLCGQLQFMSSFYNVIAVSSDKENLKLLEKNQNIKTFAVKMTRQVTPIQDLISLFKLCMFLKKTKPTIVHTHSPKAGIIGMMAARIMGVPVRLHTVAGLPLLTRTGYKRKILNLIEKLTYSCATKVYPNSFGLLQILKNKKHCADAKLQVIANGSSNGIDTTYFNSVHFSTAQNQSLRAALKINPDDFVFIFVGRLVEDKGINELIAAFAHFTNEYKDTKLLLVGSYEQHLNPLNKLTIHEIETNKNIIAVGYQNDVRPYFASANCLVFPSYREGFPNVVMQAGAMNLPSVVTNINGCNEIIIHNHNGLLIEVRNKSAIFEAMKTIYSDKKVVEIMKQNARENIVSKYEQRFVWEAILKEYELVTNS